jgi:hypothetical protein
MELSEEDLVLVRTWGLWFQYTTPSWNGPLMEGLLNRIGGFTEANKEIVRRIPLNPKYENLEKKQGLLKRIQTTLNVGGK